MSQRDDLLQNKNAFSWLKDVEIDSAQIKKTLDTDILIIGAGHAGTAAGRGVIEGQPSPDRTVFQTAGNSKWPFD